MTMHFSSGDQIVSVIIPCLNEEEPIGQVVREVLAQNVDEVVARPAVHERICGENHRMPKPHEVRTLKMLDAVKHGFVAAKGDAGAAWQ